MKTIEQTIKQSKPFKDEWLRALVNMVYTSNIVFDRMNKVIEQYDISYKQFNVMRIVKGAKENVSTSYIRQRLLAKNSDSSRLVDRLVQKGLLQKTKCGDDARLISISLTKTGTDLLEEIGDKKISDNNPIQQLSEKECIQLNKLLNKIRS